MDQVHTPPVGRKKQGWHQQKFPQTWSKLTHLLRAGKHPDSIRTSFPQKWIQFTHILRAGKHKYNISTSFHRNESNSHTSKGRNKKRQQQQKSPKTWNKFKHTLRAGKTKKEKKQNL